MSKALFGFLCGVENLDMSGTKLEFAALVIKKYKESGQCLVEISVSRNTMGSLSVLAFVGAELKVLNVSGCANITGEENSSNLLSRTIPAPFFRGPVR
jgi:hypothetical protein